MINEEKLDAIVDQLRSEAEWTESYYTENEDNSIAEYVDSVGYGGELLHMVEDRIRDDRHLERDISEDEMAYLKAIIKLDKKTAAQKIREICTLSFDPTYYNNRYEVCSMQLGEQEVCIDHIEGLSDLTADEIKYVVDQVSGFAHLDTKSDGSLSSYMTIDMGYGRWYLSIDPDLLSDQVKQTLPAPQKTQLKLISGGLR
jgi:hypothetical protein